MTDYSRQVVEWVQGLRGLAESRGLGSGGILLAVDAGCAQQLYVVEAQGRIVCRYPVSTSRYGLGEEQDSNRTPRGFHAVGKRYGDACAKGAVFENRVPTGEVLSPADWSGGTEDLVLTRIMRLKGLEPGLNAGGSVDTYERLIYLHGTNHEDLLGVKAASSGCIRMSNADVITLFDFTRGRETWVWIGPAGEEEPSQSSSLNA